LPPKKYSLDPTEYSAVDFHSLAHECPGKGSTLSYHHEKPMQVTVQLINEQRPGGNARLPPSMSHQCTLLTFRLHGHKAHIGSINGLSIICVILVFSSVWHHKHAID